MCFTNVFTYVFTYVFTTMISPMSLPGMFSPLVFHTFYDARLLGLALGARHLLHGAAWDKLRKGGHPW